MSTLLFVYGTLKRGCSNHHYLEGQQYVAQAGTRPLFRLYDMGGYPGMVRDEHAGEAVMGEVWEVDDACLAKLDVLEDVAGGEYVRELIPLEGLFADQTVEGYRYLLDVSGRRLLGGCW